jgi:hypothetical protein
MLERNITLCGSEDSQNMLHLLPATVSWRQRGASASENENETKSRALLSGCSRFPREHHVFGSAAGWCCLFAADGRIEGEDDYRALVKCQWEYSEIKTCPNATLPTTNPTLTSPELNEVYRG